MAQVATLQSAPAGAPARPRKALGLWASMALVIGNMIGSGIFLLPATGRDISHAASHLGYKYCTSRVWSSSCKIN